MKTFHTTEPVSTPSSPLLDSESTEDKGWTQVADALPLELRELLLGGRKFGE